jgi:NTE family protein
VLASYLLFAPGYIQALIDLGQADTLARRSEVIRFFGWERRRAQRPAPYIVSSR